MRRRIATRAQRRALGAAVFAFAFAVGVVVSTGDVPFWVTLGARSAARVEHISVVGHDRVDAQEIVARAEIEQGTSARDVDLAGVETRVRAHRWLRSARARVASEDELLLIVEERELAAVLYSRSTDTSWAVEADGTPFAEIEASDFPDRLRLEAGPPVLPGEARPVVAEALALAARIEACGLPRPHALTLPEEEGEAAPLGWRFTLGAGGPEVVLGRTPSDERLARLAELLASRPAAVRSAERIDLRFRDRAILRTADTIPAEEASPSPSREATAGALSARLGERPAPG